MFSITTTYVGGGHTASSFPLANRSYETLGYFREHSAMNVTRWNNAPPYPSESEAKSVCQEYIVEVTLHSPLRVDGPEEVVVHPLLLCPSRLITWPWYALCM